MRGYRAVEQFVTVAITHHQDIALTHLVIENDLGGDGAIGADFLSAVYAVRPGTLQFNTEPGGPRIRIRIRAVGVGVCAPVFTPLIRFEIALRQAHTHRTQQFLDTGDGKRSDAIGFDDFTNAHQLYKVVPFRNGITPLSGYSLSARLQRGLSLRIKNRNRSSLIGYRDGHIQGRALLAHETKNAIVAKIEIGLGAGSGDQHLIAPQAIANPELAALAIGRLSPGLTNKGYNDCRNIHIDLD